MSLHPQQPIPPVPEDTARVARAAFRRGNPYVLLRDRLGVVFDDAAFADLYPKLGQPAYAPWRLALVTVLQFREGLSDRQAADAVRGRIDWKYLLALDLADAGFDFSVLCEFRGRLIEHRAGERLLERLLDAAREGGLLKARGRQRTDSTHVLAAIRTLNRLELLGETMRAALNAVAAVTPEWLRTVAPADWHERYDCRVENARLPEAEAKREAYAVQIGVDGFLLLDALDRPGTPERAAALPAVAVLRRVWMRHFARAAPDADGTGRDGPTTVRLLRTRGDDKQRTNRIESPYDTEARFRIRAGREWVGYVAHFTETCDDHLPRLIVHADTTDASGHEATRIGPIHDALAGKGLPPSEHLVDTAYVAADQLVTARMQHGIDLIGPQHRNVRWQAADQDAFDISDFVVDWDHEVVRCPEGKQSAAWATYANRKRPHRPVQVQVRFRVADCRACPSRARCTRAAPTRGRYLMLSPKLEHEALVGARARERTDEFRRLYAMRRGIESTMSQGVRAFGLRRARYRGLAKAGLQHLATAAAINLDRLTAWFTGRPLAPTRVSRFAALAT